MHARTVIIQVGPRTAPSLSVRFPKFLGSWLDTNQLLVVTTKQLKEKLAKVGITQPFTKEIAMAATSAERDLWRRQIQAAIEVRLVAVAASQSSVATEETEDTLVDDEEQMLEDLLGDI